MFYSPRVCEGTKPTAAGIISGKNNEPNSRNDLYLSTR
jgi:hypothetical protein